MEVVSLKTYWFKENVSHVKQKELNKLLDDILASKGCEKGDIDRRDVLKAIEWCDYLFILKQNGKIATFAFGSDHSDTTFSIWAKTFSKPQGYLYLDLICSNIVKSGSTLLSAIKIFAKTTLNRKQLILHSLNNKKLVNYYQKHNFHISKTQKYENLVEMYCLL